MEGFLGWGLKGVGGGRAGEAQQLSLFCNTCMLSMIRLFLYTIGNKISINTN